MEVLHLAGTSASTLQVAARAYQTRFTSSMTGAAVQEKQKISVTSTVRKETQVWRGVTVLTVWSRYGGITGRYFLLYGVGHMVKDLSERGNLLLPHGLLFPISSKGSFICTIPQTHTIYLWYTIHGALAGTRNS